jgi:DNA polymerase I-like protein with 3'-5' exonuclease and polymerase domains
LHQLRAQEDPYSPGAKGTVSGRFSSADVNIQQVFTPDAQRAKRQGAFLVRSLFVPANGVWLSADAQAIEYRLAASYMKNPRVIAAYQQDPWTDYHNVVRDLLDFRGPRRSLKILNFSQLYGASLAKFIDMLGGDPEAAVALRERYFAMMPEAKPLLQRTSALASPGHTDYCRSHCARLHRGYVKTILGRRARFNPGDRFYSALNRIIQGSAADINKLVLVALYRERAQLGLTLRFSVHDEVNGDLQDPSRLNDVREVLNTQYLPTLVPILWQTGLGPTWAEAK